MSNVKGNDIDDLFKRASDKYPLRTDSADWDKLAAALEKDPSLIPPSDMEDEKRKRRRFFWLFLLLPLGGLVYYFGHNSGHTTQTAVSVSNKQAPVQPGTESSGQTQAQTGSNSGTGLTVPGQEGVSADAAGRSTGSTAASKSGLVTTGQSGSVPGNTAQGFAERKVADQKRIEREVTDRKIADLKGPDGNGADRKGTERLAADHKAADRKLADLKKANRKVDLGAPMPAGNVTIDEDPKLSNLNSQRARMSNGVALNVTVKGNNTSTIAKDSSSKKSTAKNDKKKQSFFYAGLSFAPDLSTIKMQSVKSVGTTYGVLLGYNINRKWAVETGVYIDRKKYYSDAEYFSKKNTPALNSYDLLNFNGVCNMVEIPVNLRYNLSSGEKTKWFATAGLSTYLMSREKYTFEIDQNNPWSKTWAYPNHANYWFSIVNLSIGYEQRLGKIGNLRLEPYLRVPLSGIGTGSLPIMSAGLNIGITHKLW